MERPYHTILILAQICESDVDSYQNSIFKQIQQMIECEKMSFIA